MINGVNAGSHADAGVVILVSWVQAWVRVHMQARAVRSSTRIIRNPPQAPGTQDTFIL